MNAPMRRIDGGPYEAISPVKRGHGPDGSFTVLQLTMPHSKVKLGKNLPKRSLAADDYVMFPVWVRIGFVIGAAGLMIAFVSSVVLFLFDSRAVYWLTLVALAVGVTALAVSLTSAKKHVGRAGRSADARQPTGTAGAKV